MSTDFRPRFPWPWLVPSLALMIAIIVWAATVYPELPAKVPQHIGPNGVDAWAHKTLGSVFVPVFVYIGTTMVFAGTAFGIVRTTSEDEVPHDRCVGVMNRPATRVSAARSARAALMLNIALGLALLPMCVVQWRTTRTPEVSWWLLLAPLVLIIVGLVPLFVAAGRDWGRSAERRAAP